MVLLKDGKKVKPKKKMTAKIVISRIFVITVLIVVPVYLVGLIKVFFEGGERQTEKTDCAVIIMPETDEGETSLGHFEHAIDTAIHIKEKRAVKFLIFTGFEGHFSEAEVGAINDALFTTPSVLILPHEVTFTPPMKDYEEMAETVENYMVDNYLSSAMVVNNSYYMAKTLLYFRRVDDQLGNDLILKGFPYLVPETERKQAKDWWYIYREALYYIYYFVFEHPGKKT
jgi:hypothetical protein